MKRCCFCKCRRPDPASKATREGWRGARVCKRGEKSHWSCPLHDRVFKDIMGHAEDVADRKVKCEVT